MIITIVSVWPWHRLGHLTSTLNLQVRHFNQPCSNSMMEHLTLSVGSSFLRLPYNLMYHMFKFGPITAVFDDWLECLMQVNDSIWCTGVMTSIGCLNLLLSPIASHKHSVWCYNNQLEASILIKIRIMLHSTTDVTFCSCTSIFFCFDHTSISTRLFVKWNEPKHWLSFTLSGLSSAIHHSSHVYRPTSQLIGPLHVDQQNSIITRKSNFTTE